MGKPQITFRRRTIFMIGLIIILLTALLLGIYFTMVPRNIQNAQTMTDAQYASAINRAALLFMAAMALFAAALYIVHRRLFFLPIEKLNADIRTKPDKLLSSNIYSNTREFVELCDTINATTTHLRQSHNFQHVLQNIIDTIDACIYLADPETDELLFINETTRLLFQVEGELSGQVCYRAFRGRDSRCDNCPIDQLSKAPDQPITWESYNHTTGRYYQNMDCFIEWFGGKRVRLEHSVDITDRKAASQALERRLQQQSLMSDISQAFISTDELDMRIQRALALTGEFMNASKIVITAIDEANTELGLLYGWHNSRNETGGLQKRSLPFQPGHEMYDAFITGGEPYIACSDSAAVERYQYMRDFGVTAFIMAPILVDGRFWGSIIVDECSGPRSWTESDIQLVQLISSTLSVAIARHEAEADLKRMSSLVNSSPQMIDYITHDGRFVYCNPGMQTALGYTMEEFMGQNISMIMDNATYRRVIEDILPQVREKGSLEFELPILCKNGEERIFSFNSFAADITPEGIGAIASDITEQKRLERELIAAKELAESGSRAKSNFLSRMSHEMRTPMSAIIGMTNIAKSSDDPEKQQYCLDRISDASNHLLGVINDILDMSKIEANKFELSYTEFNFEKMLMRVVDVVNFRVDEKLQNFVVRLDPAIPTFLVSDEQRVAQVITNLLSNAIKFTPEKGDIALTATKIGEDDDQCILQIEVRDTGIGITEEQQTRLFRAFEQADGGISRKFGGTGLGLAITKSIVDMLGGSIKVQSIPGEGCLFTCTLSMRRGTYTHHTRLLAPGINWKNLHALVVDDSQDVLEYFKTVASTIGLRCSVAQNGGEACRMIRENKSTPYHIVFVDWRMPDMNGIELTKNIKQMMGTDIVVIMISVAEWTEIEEEARRAGVDGFVPKPLFPSRIVDCINECLGAPEPQAGVRAEASYFADNFAGSRILLAEDIDINREILQALLADTGIQIDCAENGGQAVSMFRDAPDAYDMIFMDIQMPEMDGYEATRRIRALELPQAKTIPIIAMTANVFREDVERCLNAGMNGHVGKPINTEEMFEKLRKYIGKRKRRRSE